MRYYQTSPKRSFVFWRRTIIASLTLLFLSAALSPVHAQSIIITDCQGLTRAIKSLRGGEKGRVDVQVKSSAGTPSNGTRVTLTNTTSGQSVTTTANGGIASFDGVGNGVFSVTTEQTGISLGSILVEPAAVVAGGVSAGGITGVVVGGGGVAIADAAGPNLIGDATGSSGSGSKSGDSGSTPTPTPTSSGSGPDSTPTPSTSPTPTPTPQASPETPAEPDCPCDPDAEPTPLPPFFNSKQPASEATATARARNSRDALSPSW